jgi:hypothetical protein
MSHLSAARTSTDVLGTVWRMIFLVNVPIGIVTVLAGLRFLPASPASRQLRSDVVGAALASIAGLLLVYPLVQGREHGWPAWTFVMLAGSAVGFAVFGRYETRIERPGCVAAPGPPCFTCRRSRV